MRTIAIKTNRRNEFLDITEDVVKTVNQSGLQDGIVVVYVPHTTAGVTINENADPTVRTDFESHLNIMVPEKHFDLEYIREIGPIAAVATGLALRKDEVVHK